MPLERQFERMTRSLCVQVEFTMAVIQTCNLPFIQIGKVKVLFDYPRARVHNNPLFGISDSLPSDITETMTFSKRVLAEIPSHLELKRQIKRISIYLRMHWSLVNDQVDVKHEEHWFSPIQ